MTPMRAHSRLVLKSESVMLLTSSSSRRIVFFFLFVVFAVAMIVGFDPSTDLVGSRLFGTIGYAAVLLVLLGVTAWSMTIRFDRDRGRMETVKSFFGVIFSHDRGIELGIVKAIVLQKVQLIKGRDLPLNRSNRISNLLEPRAQLFRLFLDTGERRIKLDESNYREELENEASMIANFLGVVRKTEEL